MSNFRKRSANSSWEERNHVKAPRYSQLDPTAIPPPIVPPNQSYEQAPRRAPISQPAAPAAIKPTIRHGPHPDSKLCQDFHWVPYPLGLMPYDSWHKLHHLQSLSPFRCPVCRKPRNPTAHARKVFLIAERLTWEDGKVSMHEKDQHEQKLWQVNYELGILEPCVEDPQQIPGGNRSRTNQWYPYENEYEMKQALNLIFVSGNITEASWSLWIGLQRSLQKLLVCEKASGNDSKPSGSSTPRPGTPPQSEAGALTRQTWSGSVKGAVSPDRASNLKVTDQLCFGLPRPPSSLPTDTCRGLALPSTAIQFATTREPSTNGQRDVLAAEQAPTQLSSTQERSIVSYQTLQDFYSLLDQIERTSYVGALFLEAYAEQLRDDMCRDCWFKHNVAPVSR